MTPVQATLVGTFIGGILGIIAALIGAYHGVRIQSRRNAEQTFSDSIHEILEGMYPEQINWPKNSWQVLQDKMPEINTAIAKLKFHLKPVEITRIDTAWEKYKEWCHQINDAEIAASPFYKEPMPSINHKAVFKRHVDALLSYSK